MNPAPRFRFDPGLAVTLVIAVIAGGVVVHYTAKKIPNRAVGGVASQLAGDTPVEENPLQTIRATGDVRGVGWGADGQTLFVGDRDTLSVVEVSTGKVLRSFDTDETGVRSLAVSPGGTAVAVSLTYTGEIRLYDAGGADKAKPVATLRTGSDADTNALVWAADGNTLASGGADKTARVWNAGATGTGGSAAGAVLDTTKNSGVGGRLLQRALKTGDAIGALAFLDGDKRVVIGAGPKATIYSAADGKPGQTFYAGKGSVTALAASPDGKTLAVGTSDGALVLFETATGRKIADAGLDAKGDSRRHHGAARPRGVALPTTAVGAAVSAVAFTGDGESVIGAWRKGLIIACDPATGVPTRIWAQEEPSEALSLALSPDGGRFAAGYADGSVRVWKR